MAVLRAGLRGSFLYSSAVEKSSQVSHAVHIAHVRFLSTSILVTLISSFNSRCSSSHVGRLQYHDQDGEKENVQAARVVASELMPYAMTRPVIETALAPLSLSNKCILRARARASHRVESAES